MMTRPRFNPYLLLVLASLFWAGNMVMGRGLRDDLPPVALAFWRWVVAFACVLPLALPHLKAQWPMLRAAWKQVQPNADLSEIAGKVKRAVELVAFCREYLKGLQNDADKILT